MEEEQQRTEEAQFEKRKKELEIQKLENENLKLRAERQKVIYETRILRKQGGLFMGVTFETLGKIILGAGSMAFAVALYIYPFFNLKQAELESATRVIQGQRDSLRSELDESKQILSNNEAALEKTKLEQIQLNESIKQKQAVINSISSTEAQIQILDNRIQGLIECLPAKVNEYAIVTYWNPYIISRDNMPSELKLRITSCFSDIVYFYRKTFKGKKNKDFENIVNSTEVVSIALIHDILENMTGTGNLSEKEEFLRQYNEKLKPVIGDMRSRVLKVVRD